MKRWIFLLALPYVVQVSTQEADCKYRPVNCTATQLCVAHEKYDCKTDTFVHLSPFTCVVDEGENCEWVHDLAEAMNEAHKRRTEKSK